MAHIYPQAYAHAQPQARTPRGRTPSAVRSEIMVLLAMCVFAFLVLGAFLAVKFLPAQDYEFGRFVHNYLNPRNEQALVLGQVQLGTTMDRVRDDHRHAVKGVTRDGSITLAFLDGQDKYIVWYGENGPYHVAYRARQTRVVEGVSEDELVGAIVERYGAPSLASCSKRMTDGLRDCQFSWWIPGEVRMDVNSRQDTRGPTTKLTVTTQITDTRMAGRLQRTASRTAATTHN